MNIERKLYQALLAWKPTETQVYQGVLRQITVTSTNHYYRFTTIEKRQASERKPAFLSLLFCC